MKRKMVLIFDFVTYPITFLITLFLVAVWLIEFLLLYVTQRVFDRTKNWCEQQALGGLYAVIRLCEIIRPGVDWLEVWASYNVFCISHNHEELTYPMKK